MTLFEQHTEGVTKQIVLGSVGEATQELIQKSNECGMMLQDYRNCLDPEEREILRPVAAEAMAERRECNKKLQALADLLETQFGISA